VLAAQQLFDAMAIAAEALPQRCRIHAVRAAQHVERGAEKQRSANPEFSQELFRWLETLERNFADRILNITPGIARQWGALSAKLNHDGADLLVAATAKEHRLAVVTRNTKHFAPAGVKVVDPFS